MQKPKKRQGSRTKYVALALIIAVTIIVAAVIVVYLPKTPMKVSEYLKVEPAGIFGNYVNNGTQIHAVNLGLKITAVGGNAKSVVVYCETVSFDIPDDKDYLVIYNITKGASWSEGIVLKPNSNLPIVNDKVTIEFTVSCHEISNAAPETIILEYTREDIVAPPE